MCETHKYIPTSQETPVNNITSKHTSQDEYQNRLAKLLREIPATKQLSEIMKLNEEFLYGYN